MRKQIKHALSKYAPGVLKIVQSAGRKRMRKREEDIATRLSCFRQQVIDRFDVTVQQGPVRGMKCRPSSRSDSLMPRLVGCYEEEIHSSIEAALARNPTALVDIGFEEGYFAAGLAMRMPGSTMYAYDTNPAAQGWCREMVQLNGLEKNVVIAGECTPEILESVLGSRGFVLCDCEGFEYDILDLKRTPSLRTADLIVELHDHVRADVDITGSILERFAATHDATLLDRYDRDPNAYPCVNWLTPEQRVLTVYEPRMKYQQWVFLRSKAR